MNKIFWGMVGIIVIGFAVMIAFFGGGAKTQVKVKMSQVASISEFAEGVAKRLYLEIKESPVLIVGITPGDRDHISLVSELKLALQKEQINFDFVALDSNLGEAPGFEFNQKVNVREIATLKEGMKNAQAQQKRLLVLTGNLFSSQMIERGLTSQMKEQGLQFISVSMAHFPRSRAEEKDPEIRCDTPVADTEGTGHLGCAILQMARGMYNKTLDPLKFTGRLDQSGATDYILLFQKNVN